MAAAIRRIKRDQTRDYMEAYRERRREDLRAYNRDWMRRYRAALRQIRQGAA